MNKNLLIIGMGQYGDVAKEIAISTSCFDKIEFLDDNNPSAIDKIADIEVFSEKFKWAIVSIGNPIKRKELIDLLKKYNYKIATLIHPLAAVSSSARIGEGCIIEPYVVVNPNCEVGQGTLICAGSIINHNCIIGDFCHLDVGCIVSSNSYINDSIKIECGDIYK